MRYISTRGKAPALNFEEVVLTGLASDGGLYVPEQLPFYSKEEIASWHGLDYRELAFILFQPFIDGAVSDDELKTIISEAYSGFAHDAVAPLVQTGHNHWVLELFHGPTLAFKDFALQFLGHLLEHILEKHQKKVVVLGATSGDTGSAAIEGCRRCDNIDVFILHPHQRVSEVQRRQMTTVLDDNVFNIAMQGNFDDCQNIVKRSFSDQSFLPDDRQLVAINSINWARVMAQIVYYFYASLALGGPAQTVSFSVPTGNFGDIFAGYLARRMGLPIGQLVIATNANDILHRCLTSNDHSRHTLEHTLSPSMDIMVSSNFERLLFDLYDRDGRQIGEMMEQFRAAPLVLSDEALQRARVLFCSQRMSDDETVDAIRRIYQHGHYVADPHTAIGMAAARACRTDHAQPMIAMATAHPAKFPDAVRQAIGDVEIPVPAHLEGLFEREERYQVMSNDIDEVHQYIGNKI